ncbi:DUF5676 family membrane protein [Coraliomargarita sp. SDUM461004]|uniref:DUF5676 family membrane protein n=1 Tax=Thalassobacterium sedimentorum TaxID=3041258 RepID=A0ABU1ANG9_9BACT|nr:DUF5676 family membrane protein [Coraliomargarita sp. SDUM461004]MDQ8195306.1 DUF5676 family membrane protein [Coraliomargarita sp. SDUM461004]
MYLHPKRFGMACAAAAGTFYLGCVLLMAVAGPVTLTLFFNGLFHGIDLRPILVEHVGFWMTLTGWINTVILSWLFGALVAVVYNFGHRPNHENS